MSVHPERGPAEADLGRSAWTEVPDGALVLVPLGSTEQHGPHLPLNTDSVIARHLARLTRDVLTAQDPESPVLLLPAIEYGASGEHAAFPGTVSLGHEALRLVLVETVRSLSLWAGRIVLVNGHGGNVPTLDAAVGQLRDEGHDVAWTGYEVAGGDAHAGRTETSLMLFLTPDDVRTGQARPGVTRPLAEVMRDLTTRGVRAVSPSGVLGDPTGATAEEGRVMMEAMVTTAARRIAAAQTDSRGRLTDAAATSVPPDPAVT
ncbi:mycofactocin biosynthesis peptidyl-dipeptidase MftE [Streptomyces sp. AD55]|uniref:mycofactocin biosynthesis peptidyl-dipeptidase MftE n=1 Tax=Streptomyces sp. AD55 TaxID=3242895 RepID=UPI003529BAC9